MSGTQRCKRCGGVCYTAALDDAGICLECVIADEACQTGLEPAEGETGDECSRCPVCGEEVMADEGNAYARCSNGHKSCSPGTF